jgi:hypothetical protein
MPIFPNSRQNVAQRGSVVERQLVWRNALVEHTDGFADWLDLQLQGLEDRQRAFWTQQSLLIALIAKLDSEH